MKNPTDNPDLNKRVDFWLSWAEKNWPNIFCDGWEEVFINLYNEKNQEYQERLLQDKDRKPEFKVGDKVKVRTGEYFDPSFTGKVTVVGIFDNDLGGGMPFDPDNPPLVYAYSVERDRGDWGVFIYKGVPEFHLTSTKKAKR